MVHLHSGNVLSSFDTFKGKRFIRMLHDLSNVEDQWGNGGCDVCMFCFCEITKKECKVYLDQSHKVIMKENHPDLARCVFCKNFTSNFLTQVFAGTELCM